jgi:tRNA dimethylallyltransferase
LADERPPLLVLFGPTAVGKTALSLTWAEAIDAEIVCADSTTVYRRLDVGTAKPTAAERRRVPHHLLDVVEPQETFSAAQFQRLAGEAIAAIHRRGRLPLMVGGTGLFIRSVVDAYPFPPPIAPDLHALLVDWLERDGLEALRRKLRLVDPVSFAAIKGQDRRRTLRALEVFLGTGRRIPRQAGPGPYRTLKVGLYRNRQELRQRIWDRALEQLSRGLLDEVLELLAAGVPPRAPAMTALGYREGVDWARGRMAEQELLPLIALHTSQYAKRQLTWFRREAGALWIDLDEVSPDQALDWAVGWTRDLLSGRTPAGQSGSLP